MSFGPVPWQQAHWDARAAGNFIGGGAGSGLVVATFASGAAGSLRVALIVLAMSLIAGGLVCVWAEIGRPWRAVNVMFNPRKSWMSREAALAPLLLGSAVLMLAGVNAAGWVAAASALAYLVCQANILRAARGIAAWREPLTAPLIVVSGLAEGTALYAAVTALWGRASAAICVALAVTLTLRVLCGIVWRRRLVRVLRGPALEALDRLRVPSLMAAPLPLFVVLAALPLPLAPGGIDALQLLAGAFAAAGGAAFKLALITRVAFNQGFALPHLPVRGVRR